MYVFFIKILYSSKEIGENKEVEISKGNWENQEYYWAFILLDVSIGYLFWMIALGLLVLFSGGPPSDIQLSRNCVRRANSVEQQSQLN